MIQEKRTQAFGISAGYDLNATASKSFRLSPLLHSHCDKDFSISPASAFPRASASDHRLIHFYITRKPRMLGMSDCAAESVQHCPSGLV
jgi:hypothetical protein